MPHPRRTKPVFGGIRPKFFGPHMDLNAAIVKPGRDHQLGSTRRRRQQIREDSNFKHGGRNMMRCELGTAASRKDVLFQLEPRTAGARKDYSPSAAVPQSVCVFRKRSCERS